MPIALVLLIYALVVAVILVILFAIIRGAILSALAEDRRRVAAAAVPVAPRARHLDEDGV
jgi:Na+-driven multidrug efflux pump